MSRHGKRRAKKLGLPPGTLLPHVEDAQPESSKITIIDYDEKYFHAEQTHLAEALIPYKTSPTVTWINVDTINDVKLLEKMGSIFNLHHLTLEDIQSADQRPKLDDYETYLYIDLKILSYNEEKNDIEQEALSLVLGPSYVITFHERESGVLNPIRERIRSHGGRIRKMGADYLAYCLVDTVVDHYFVIMEKLDEKIESLQDDVMSNPTPTLLREINDIKQMIIALRKTIWPLRDVIVRMERRDSNLIADSTRVFLRDVYDHTIHIMDTIETFRDLVSGILDIYLSSSSNKLNEVIKFLTIISTIFIPLTFIAGVYGMNFKHFPELDWQYGYLYFWIFNISAVGLMLYYFKKKGWL
jgi:magnesium transporter